MPLLGFLRYCRDLSRFLVSSDPERRIVVYAEDAGSWPHLGPIVDELLERFDGFVSYVTSDPADPRLHRYHPRLRSFCVGEGAMRTFFFLSLRADVILMTVPDLQTFHIKRSRTCPVHYVYVFHSLVSTHMSYRPGAFDHFDTIFCSGPHHVDEIRATESVHGLKPKNLIEHGYGCLDAIRRDATAQEPLPPAPVRVLVAPSWGPQGLIETQGPRLATILLDAGFHVTFRPHPVTAGRCPRALEEVRQQYGNHPSFELDTDMVSRDSLLGSHVMISDWSGAALEYALGLERPVIFVDLPRKVNNPDYARIPLEPLEVSIRSDIGEIIPANGLAQLPQAILRLCADPHAFRARILEARNRTVYNLGRSGGVGVAAVLDILDRLRKPAISEP